MSPITSIEKQTDNPFLNLYHLTFTDRAGGEGNYYYCTRNSDERIKVRTHATDAEGIIIYAVTEEAEPRLVLIREYRFPIDDEIVSLPAGLIDPGETAAQAAAREMREECGYAFTEYTGGEDFYRRPFFLAPGFSDEPGAAIFGTVDISSPAPANEPTEWITPMLCTRDEVRRILAEERVSVRTAFLCFAFLQMENGAPFRFLDGGLR